MLVRWGIISTARINRKFIAGARQSSALEILAVASGPGAPRSAGALRLRTNGIDRAYVDMTRCWAIRMSTAVYISLPNSMHVEWTVRGTRGRQARAVREADGAARGRPYSEPSTSPTARAGC